MQDAERKLCREAFKKTSQRGTKVPHIEPGSATRVPAGRSVAAIDSFSLRERERFRRGLATPPETNPLRYACTFFSTKDRVPASCCLPKQKRRNPWLA